MPMVEDLTVFFNDAEHGTKVVLDNVPVTGIFDNAFDIVLDGVATRGPVLQLPSASAARVKSGTSTVRIVDGAFAGNVYRVRVPEPDGTGITLLPLDLVQGRAL